MKSLSQLIFLFAFTVLLIAPVFLSDQFGPYPLMKAGLVPGSLQDV
jgi:hypothetical protein